jgi:pyruvate dehydrogenase E1 component beta subunit
MKTGRVMIVHEACKTGGFGGELAAVITESEAFNYMDAPILRICGADVPIPYNPKLDASIVPTTPVILDGIKKLME